MSSKDKKFKTALHIMDGIEQPSQMNDKLLESIKSKKSNKPDLNYFFEGIIKGDRVILSKAITIIESKLESHQELAASLIDKCLPYSGNSIRVGITGVPGAGKSTFIEAMGMHLISLGHKIAVLAVDPSSERSRGSILGDKTRMESLSAEEKAYIRPSPSGGTLGGVTRKTRETILLCEAAGYEIIFVETVGVGQSEIAVKSMVDFFLLLMLSGTGDELQGIKRGIMEMADAILVHKADGDNHKRALSLVPTYQNALHLFPKAESDWNPKVMACSSISNFNIPEVWEMINDYKLFTHSNGYFVHNRQEQETSRLYQSIEDYLKNSFFKDSKIKNSIKNYEELVKKQQISPYQAALELIKLYRD